MEEEHPKVFISYSHDDENGDETHKKWVKQLATKLRLHGVDAILDQFEARYGDNLPFFMEESLTKSRLVVCVCSENYVKKADNGMKGTG